MAQRFMYLNQGMLTCYDESGNQVLKIKATTGKVGSKDKYIHNAGPIPSGKYTLYPDEITGGLSLKTLWRNIPVVPGGGDWGVYRAPLHESPDTYIPDGRDPGSFFIHGGFLAGSAGCIDVGTPYDVVLFNYILASPDPVLVIVSENPTNWTNEEMATFEQSDEYKNYRALRQQQGW